MNIITFNYNWNKKLGNAAFTTIRLQSNKYKIGETYFIDLQTGRRKISMGKAVCTDIKNFTIDKINNYIAFLDTGYPPEECRQIIQTMYKNHTPVIDWNTQQISLILLVKVKDTEPKQNQ